MVDFFELSNGHLYIAIAISVINGLLLCFMGNKFLQIMQLSGYHQRGYYDWLKTSGGWYVGRLAMIVILSASCMMVVDVIFQPYSSYFAYLGMIFYIVFSAVFIWNIYCTPNRSPLKLTNRINRTMFLLWLLCSAITFGLLILSESFISIFRLMGVAIMPLFLPFLVSFVTLLLAPTERAMGRVFVRKAKRKLATYPDLVRVGITGSFGKTSTKNFLDTILREKYSVCATPFNYNTPMGITKTVLQDLSFGHQVFIAEMGARQRGDIKELCEIVEPTFGILTSVGAQHIATFKNQENVKRTKAELPEYLGENGTCVFNIDNEIVREIADESKCKKITVSTVDKTADIFASDIVTNTTGTSFNLHFDGATYECFTKLFGLHSVSNLLLCVGLARELGLTPKQIVTGISKVEPVDHRLQLIHAPNNVAVLDDTYNSSIEGSKRALEVLEMFEGRRKIVVSPGLVELGTMERLENYNFGQRIAKVADLVVIVNKVHLASIKQGLIDAGFDEDKIYEASNTRDAENVVKTLILKDDVVLWENDLPDNYI